MGDRISIQFRNVGEESVVLFSHWGGMDFYKDVNKYIHNLKKEIKQSGNKVRTPLHRLEPNTVMVDFIRYITKDLLRVEGDLYLGATEEDGDNSDNGHYIIDL